MLRRRWAAFHVFIFFHCPTPVFEIVQVLERLRCPRLLTELMLLVYRFIMIMMDTCRSMSTAADARLGVYDREKHG